MPQLSLYIDDETMDKLRENAERCGKSLSKYVVSVLKEHEENRGWPEGWFSLYGSMAHADWLVEPEDVPFELDDKIPALDDMEAWEKVL